MSFFCADKISAGYGGENVIENVSFSVDEGSLTGIIGANGSGKTTLLKAICGILPHKGNCQINGDVFEQKSPRELARLCSYIPQRSGISIDISAIDVVLMGFNPYLGLLENPTSNMKKSALESLVKVGLGEYAYTNYLHLSEGQKQLCILARTLVSGSKLLLLDEPESALDFRFRHRMLSHLRDYVTEKNGSAIVTLHDPVLALNHCDRLILLDKGSVLGVISPQADNIEKMEQLLCQVYGEISLQWCTNRSGKSCLVMLKEEN